MCREEATELASFHQKLVAEHSINVKLVGVLHENRGITAFRPFFPGGQLFLDPDRGIYKAMGDLYLGLGGFFLPSVWSNLRRAKDKQVEGNMEGEGRYLGGLLIVENNNVVYEYKEKVWGDHAPLDQVTKALMKFKKQE